MTPEEAIITLKDSLCGSCYYMGSCDNIDCDNREAFKALEQKFCNDAISRQEVFKQIDQWAIGNREYLPTNAMHYLTKRIQDIQPIKTGQWIKKEIIMERDFSTVKTYRSVCSHCGIINISKYKNYCPNCGCRMIDPQKSEDKNGKC